MLKRFQFSKVSLLVILFIAVLVSGCAQKVDLSEYCTVTFEGMNGNGRAYLNTNMAQFKNILIDKNKDDVENLQKVFEIESNIKYSLENKENLSNGDEVIVKIEWDKDIAKKYNYEFTPSQLVYTVENLPEGKIINLFEGIDVNFSGTSPDGKADILNNSSEPFIENVRYSLNKSDGLKNGDVVILTAQYSDNVAEKNFVIINNDKKKFSVSGLDEYITNYDSIDENTHTKMKKQARDLIESTLADSYEAKTLLHPDIFIWSYDLDSLNIKNIQLFESYFFKIKQGYELKYGDVHNSVFMIYAIEYSDSKNPEGELVYVPVYFSEFIDRNGSTDVIITDGKIISNSYDNHDNLYRDIVTKNKDIYDFEEIKH